MKSSFTAILAVTGLSLSLSLAQPSTNHAPRRIPLLPVMKVLKDLEYGRGSDRAVLLDLYLPEQSNGPLPLIVWVHGGGWTGGSEDNPSPALRFATDGYAVAQVGYRLSQEAIFPAQIHDCKAAVRWLRANTYVSKDAPPFLIMHGDQDHTVPFRQSAALAEALKKEGVEVTLVPMKGAGHGFRGPDALVPVRDFLKRCFNTPKR